MESCKVKRVPLLCQAGFKKHCGYLFLPIQSDMLGGEGGYWLSGKKNNPQGEEGKTKTLKRQVHSNTMFNGYSGCEKSLGSRLLIVDEEAVQAVQVCRMRSSGVFRFSIQETWKKQLRH